MGVGDLHRGARKQITWTRGSQSMGQISWTCNMLMGAWVEALEALERDMIVHAH